MQEVNQTPNEKIEAVRNLKSRMETDFVELGQLLSEIKAKKIFQFKGYDTFKDFVQAEYNLNLQLCNKLIRVYDLYVNRLDMSEAEIQEYGFERLNLIAPILEKGNDEAREEWLEKAEQMTSGELQEHIKELNKKNKQLSVKEVLVEQFVEQMGTYFNCSRKEVLFKVALYFQDMDLDVVRDVVKRAQRKFEQVAEG